VTLIPPFECLQVNAAPWSCRLQIRHGTRQPDFEGGTGRSSRRGSTLATHDEDGIVNLERLRTLWARECTTVIHGENDFQGGNSETRRWGSSESASKRSQL
jgi:hypothetical protein